MVSIAWLGQMGLKISVNATTVFVDYFASDCPGRRTPVPVAVEGVRGVDAFLGTHDHLDHIDHDAWRVWASASYTLWTNRGSAMRFLNLSARA